MQVEAIINRIKEHAERYEFQDAVGWHSLGRFERLVRFVCSSFVESAEEKCWRISLETFFLAYQEHSQRQLAARGHINLWNVTKIPSWIPRYSSIQILCSICLSLSCKLRERRTLVIDTSPASSSSESWDELPYQHCRASIAYPAEEGASDWLHWDIKIGDKILPISCRPGTKLGDVKQWLSWNANVLQIPSLNYPSLTYRCCNKILADSTFSLAPYQIHMQMATDLRTV